MIANQRKAFIFRDRVQQAANLTPLHSIVTTTVVAVTRLKSYVVGITNSVLIFYILQCKKTEKRKKKKKKLPADVEEKQQNYRVLNQPALSCWNNVIKPDLKQITTLWNTFFNA